MDEQYYDYNSPQLPHDYPQAHPSTQLPLGVSTPKSHPSSSLEGHATGAPSPYVRPRKARRTVEAIDDFQGGDPSTAAGSYVNDSNITVRGRGITGSPYRRSRAQVNRLQRNSRYGQYLEIPKGKRSIFVSRERARRRNSVIIMILIVAALVIAVAFGISLILNSVK